MKCLYQFDVQQLNNLIEKELLLGHWLIRDDKIKNRTDSILCSDRFTQIKRQADRNGISYNDLEVVTWFDTLKTMYTTFSRIEDEDLKNNIIIFQEFCIPYSNKRADYILVYDNKMLIVEFSFNKLRYEFNYETKLQQAIGYKELLSNILPKEIDIGTYTFLLEPEEDGRGKAFFIEGTQYLSNHYNINDFAQYIEKFFKKNLYLAYNSIVNLDED